MCHGLGWFGGHRTHVQPPEFLISLEGETFCHEAIRWHEPRPFLQRAGEPCPCPLIELLDGATSPCKRLHFAPLEHLEQRVTQGVVRRRHLLHALLEDL